MKLIIMSDCDVSDQFFVSEIFKKYPELILIRPDYSGDSVGAQPFLGGLIDRVLGKTYRVRMRRLLFADESPRLPEAIEMPLSSIRDGKAAATLRELAPDVLLTCRAPLLPREVYTVPTIACVNLHFGIATKYRGNDSLFWAFHLGDYDALGACLHHIADGADTGALLGEVYPTLDLHESVVSIDAKCMKMITGLTLEFLSAIAAGSDTAGMPQTTRGKLYRSRDRTVYRQLWFDALNFFRFHRDSRAARVVKYF